MVDVRAAEPSVGAALDPATKEVFSTTLRGILAECLPESIEVRDDWGQTKPRFSQLKVTRDGLKLDFETRTKEANHGLWKQARIVPFEPERQLQFRIVDFRSTGAQSYEFRLFLKSPLKVTARVERWRSGVKMLNFSTDAAATIEMLLDGTVDYQFASNDAGGYFAIAPKVSAVDLRLTELDIQRISRLDGPLVHELGDWVVGPLSKQLDKYEPKATAKLNAVLVKKQDKLRVKLNLPFNLDEWELPELPALPTSLSSAAAAPLPNEQTAK